MHRAAVDVESVEPPWHDKYTDIADGTQIHKLTNLMLKESLIDQENKETLWKKKKDI